MRVTQSVPCPLDGFDGCAVVYNLMATEAALDAFYRKTGAEETATPVVASIEGWPLADVDPWGKDSPLAWRFWASRQGFAQAMASWLQNPDF